MRLGGCFRYRRDQRRAIWTKGGKSRRQIAPCAKKIIITQSPQFPTVYFYLFAKINNVLKAKFGLTLLNLSQLLHQLALLLDGGHTARRFRSPFGRLWHRGPWSSGGVLLVFQTLSAHVTNQASGTVVKGTRRTLDGDPLGASCFISGSFGARPGLLADLALIHVGLVLQRALLAGPALLFWLGLRPGGAARKTGPKVEDHYFRKSKIISRWHFYLLSMGFSRVHLAQIQASVSEPFSATSFLHSDLATRSEVTN